MPNVQHVHKLKEGARAWNAWREQNPRIDPELGDLNLPVSDRQFGAAHGGPIDLSQAGLCRATLEHATLVDADLSGAYLVGANLAHARLVRADLRGANLSNARLDHADLKDARLDHATLSGARLGNARNLTQTQIDKARGDERSVLPLGLSLPAAWRKARRRSTQVARRRPTARILVGKANPYTVLGVSPQASIQEVRAAYLKLVKELHPDAGELDPNANEQLKTINKAYQDLKARTRPTAAAPAPAPVPPRRGPRPLARFVVAFLGSSLSLLAVVGGLQFAGLLSRSEAPQQLAEADHAPAPTARPELAGAPPAPAATTRAAAETQPSDAPTSARLRNLADDAAWITARRQCTTAALHAYLGRYANGRHARRAKVDVRLVVNAEIALDRAIDARDAAALAAARTTLRQYVVAYPSGRLVVEAARKLNQIAAAEAAEADRKAWADAERIGTSEGLRRYLATNPDGEHAGHALRAIAALEASEARRRADQAAWSEAMQAGSKAGFSGYLAAFPTGDNAAFARQALAAIEASEGRRTADLEAWAKAKSNGSKEALRLYLKSFPKGDHAAAALAAINALEVEEPPAASDAIARGSLGEDGASRVLQRSDPGPDAFAAGGNAKRPLLGTAETLDEERRRDEAAWLDAQRRNVHAAYSAYLFKHPNGRHAKEARASLAELQAMSKGRPLINKAPKELTQAFGASPVGMPASQKWQSADEPFIGADGRLRQR